MLISSKYCILVYSLPKYVHLYSCLLKNIDNVLVRLGVEFCKAKRETWFNGFVSILLFFFFFSLTLSLKYSLCYLDRSSAD